MSNSSRTACSLAPAYFHHCPSKARISRSRRVSSPLRPAPEDDPSLRSVADSITLLAARLLRPTAHRMTRLSFGGAIEPRGSDRTGEDARAPRRPGSGPGYPARVAVRPIRIIGDPVLHHPTRPVEVF